MSSWDRARRELVGALLAGFVVCAMAQQAQQPHAQSIAGYWTTDVRFSTQINSKTQAEYFWVGRMWGRVDSTGKMRFDADNGCVSTGLLEPAFGGNRWSGIANMEGCKNGNLNGRYTITVTGGQANQPSLNVSLSSRRVPPGSGQTDTFEATGTFARYRP